MCPLTRRELDEQNLSRVSKPLGEKTSKILVFSFLFIFISIAKNEYYSFLAIEKCIGWQYLTRWMDVFDHLPQVCWVEHADHELHCSHLKCVWNLMFLYIFVSTYLLHFFVRPYLGVISHSPPNSRVAWSVVEREASVPQAAHWTILTTIKFDPAKYLNYLA